jgi:hypothetical protein
MKHREKLIVLSYFSSNGRLQLVLTPCDNHSGADNSQGNEGIIVIVLEILGNQIATLKQKWMGEGKEMFIKNLSRLKSYTERF